MREVAEYTTIATMNYTAQGQSLKVQRYNRRAYSVDPSESKQLSSSANGNSRVDALDEARQERNRGKQQCYKCTPILRYFQQA